VIPQRKALYREAVVPALAVFDVSFVVEEDLSDVVSEAVFVSLFSAELSVLLFPFVLPWRP